MQRASFRISITNVGWLFILLCLGVGIAGLNTGNNLLYLVFSMMMSFLILSGLLSNSTLRRLTVGAEFPHRIFASESIPVLLRLKNKKRWFPSFGLTLYPTRFGDTTRSGGFIIKIPAGSTEETVDFVSFPKRGHVSLPSFWVETSYPFGLIRKKIMVPVEEKALVYPRPLHPELFETNNQRNLGEYLSGQSGGSSHPYGIREYQQGDPARFIHWPTSARVGELMLKEFEREKKLKVVIWVQLASKEQSNAARLEKALSVATALILRLMREGFEISLFINGKAVASSGRSYIDSYLSALALATPSDEFVENRTPPESTIWISDSRSAPPPTTLLSLGAKELDRL